MGRLDDNERIRLERLYRDYNILQRDRDLTESEERQQAEAGRLLTEHYKLMDQSNLNV